MTSPNVAITPPAGGNGAVWLRSLLPALVGVPLLLLLSYVLPGKGDSYLLYIAGLAGINVVLAVSLNVVNGFTGQFSLGHAGFMAVGGYVAAAVTVAIGNRYQLSGIPTWLSDQLLFAAATIAGGVAAALAGLLVGIPSLRRRRPPAWPPRRAADRRARWGGPRAGSARRWWW